MFVFTDIFDCSCVVEQLGQLLFDSTHLGINGVQLNLLQDKSTRTGRNTLFMSYLQSMGVNLEQYRTQSVF